MKTTQLILFTVVLSFFLPREAFMSGMVSRTGISNFVYIEAAVGMKFQRGTPEMIENAQEANRQRLDALEKTVDSLARRIETIISDFSKTLPDSFEFGRIGTGYVLYDEGMSGYSDFPTISADKEAVEHSGKPCYFQLAENPTIVVRFLKLPDLKQLNLMKKVVLEVLTAIENQQ